MTDWFTITETARRCGRSQDWVRRILARNPGIGRRRDECDGRAVLVAWQDFRAVAVGARGRRLG